MDCTFFIQILWGDFTSKRPLLQHLYVTRQSAIVAMICCYFSINSWTFFYFRHLRTFDSTNWYFWCASISIAKPSDSNYLLLQRHSNLRKGFRQNKCFYGMSKGIEYVISCSFSILCIFISGFRDWRKRRIFLDLVLLSSGKYFSQIWFLQFYNFSFGFQFRYIPFC